ncbi:MAG: serine/threonine protein kinase [Pirellulales bacterium]
MSSTETKKFRDSAIVSGLITQDQIENMVAALRKKTIKQNIDDESLAEAFVESKELTRYQADQLKKGLTKLTLGAYVITDWIGQGGMGQVFKAEHNFMGREVAVKVLPLQRSTPESITRFMREIRMQAQLDHPCLVRAYDAGQDGNVHFLVTEYIPGTDLRRLIRTNGHLTQHQSAGIIARAARGLGYAHQEGMIHRDVKPGNILVTPDGKAKVSDLGLADFMNDSSGESKIGKIVGTIDYIAPEQIKNPHGITETCDLYALGCTFYYALTGKVPFPGGSVKEKARRHCEDTPWHPHRFNPDIDRELVDLVAEMMEKDPLKRIQSASEIVTRLEPWTHDIRPMQITSANDSPWLPPPPSYASVDINMEETLGGSDDYDFSGGESNSQISQATERSLFSEQDTTSIDRSTGNLNTPPLLPVTPRKTRRERQLMLALMIGIPAAALFSSLLTYIAMATAN